MLQVRSEFPHPGSHGFAAPLGEEVRIIQRNADGSALVQRILPPALRGASSTRTMPMADLHATLEAALGRRVVRRRRA